MKHLYRYLLALAILVLPSVSVLASDVSDAAFLTRIIATNNSSTAKTFVAGTANISTEGMINVGMLNATATDAAARLSGGTDTAFQPAANSTYPWCFWLPSVGGNSQTDIYLYSSGASGGKYRYFPGTAGMTVPDNATLEPSDNFTIKVSGYIDTDNGTDKYILQKEGALDVYVSPTVSENITADLYTEGWNRPTSTTSSANWTNPNNSWDADNATYADYNVLVAGWQFDYLVVSLDSAYTSNVTFEVGAQNAQITGASVDIYYDEAWHNIFSGAPTWGSYDTVNLGGLYEVSSIRFLGKCSGAGGSPEFRVHDVQLYQYTLSTSVSATGVSSGEHDLFWESNGTFHTLQVDTAYSLVDHAPSSDNLVLNLPLWSTNLQSDSIVSVDSNAIVCTNNGTAWGATGRTFSSGDNIVGTNNSVLDITSDNFTIVVWMKPDAGLVQADIYCRGLYQTDGIRFGMYGTGAAPANRLWLQTNQAAAAQQDTSATGTIDTSTQHIVASCNGTHAFFYRNGVELTYQSQGNLITPTTSARSFKLGIYDTLASSWYAGGLYEVRVYVGDCFSLADALNDYNNTKWKYDGSGDSMEYVVSTSVPDTSSDYVFFQNDVMPYAEYVEVSVGGTQAGYWDWEYGTTFVDDSGNGNAATPSFRTASSDADVTLAISSQVSVVTAEEPTTTTDWASMIQGSVPAQPDNIYTEGGTGYPGGPELDTLATETRIPYMVWATMLAIGLSLFGGLFVYAGAQNAKRGVNGSLFLFWLVSTIIYTIFGAIWAAVPMWPVVVPSLVSFLLMIWLKPYNSPVG